jgi:hypothetical protein
MENRIQKIEEEVKSIQDRNSRVETDKAWEVSVFRVLFITAITYLVASLVLYLIGVRDFYLGALVPTVGYFLSTRSLPTVKKWWVNRYFKS